MHIPFSIQPMDRTLEAIQTQEVWFKATQDQQSSHTTCFSSDKYNFAESKGTSEKNTYLSYCKEKAPPQMSCHMHRGFSERPHIFEQLLHGISSPVHTRYKSDTNVRMRKLERKFNAINMIREVIFSQTLWRT